jgi:hypothetical protein
MAGLFKKFVVRGLLRFRGRVSTKSFINIICNYTPERIGNSPPVVTLHLSAGEEEVNLNA